MNDHLIEENNSRIKTDGITEKSNEVKANLFTDIRFWIACICLIAFLAYIFLFYPRT